MKPHTERPGGAKTSKARISLFSLEKQLLGELPPDESAALENEVRINPRLSTYFENLKKCESPLDWIQMQQRVGWREPLKGRVSILTGFKNRLDSMFTNPTRAKLALAGVFGLLFLCIAPTLISPKRVSELRSKGGGRPEIVLEVSDAKIVAEKSGSVKSGDVMTFNYRSSKPIYAQIWYAEDGGTARVFDGRKDLSLFWPASSGWIKAPQRIVLEGKWKRQRIMVIASADAIPLDRANRILTGSEEPHDRVDVFTYELMQP